MLLSSEVKYTKYYLIKLLQSVVKYNSIIIIAVFKLCLKKKTKRV
jgi:hypothetical protein